MRKTGTKAVREARSTSAKNIRSETIRIFKRYARLGLGDEHLNPMQAYARIEALCLTRRSKLDMLAVYDLLRQLELLGEAEMLDAVRSVYLGGRLTSKDITERIRLCAAERFCDERTVYRRLEAARALYLKIHSREGLIWDGVK